MRPWATPRPVRGTPAGPRRGERGFGQGLAPLVGVLALALGAAGGMAALVRRSPGGPVADFDHALHVGRDIDCVICHTGVEIRARAGVPSVTICKGCHEGDAAEKMGPSGSTENTRRISDHIARGEELWWPQLYSLPAHVLFSHRRHVAIGGIACRECHGDIASAKTLPGAPVERTLMMEGCLECHARRGASTDCFACHR